MTRHRLDRERSSIREAILKERHVSDGGLSCGTEQFDSCGGEDTERGLVVDRAHAGGSRPGELYRLFHLGCVSKRALLR
jgi:hypothetical protein